MNNTYQVEVIAIEEGRMLSYRDYPLDFAQLLLDANKESAKLSVKSRSVHTMRRQRGDYIGVAPYGYKTERITRKHTDVNGVETVKTVKIVLTPNMEELAIARMIHDGVYIHVLNSKSETKRRGRPWSPASYASIANNAILMTTVDVLCGGGPVPSSRRLPVKTTDLSVEDEDSSSLSTPSEDEDSE